LNKILLPRRSNG